MFCQTSHPDVSSLENKNGRCPVGTAPIGYRSCLIFVLALVQHKPHSSRSGRIRRKVLACLFDRSTLLSSRRNAEAETTRTTLLAGVLLWVFMMVLLKFELDLFGLLTPMCHCLVIGYLWFVVYKRLLVSASHAQRWAVGKQNGAAG